MIDRGYNMDYGEIRKKLGEICRSYNDILGLVILFGSFSREEATEVSDIDLYVEPKDIRMTTTKLWHNRRYKEFQYKLYDNFSQEFDILAYGGKRDISVMKNTALWQQIKKDGVTIYDQRAEIV